MKKSILILLILFIANMALAGEFLTINFIEYGEKKSFTYNKNQIHYLERRSNNFTLEITPGRVSRHSYNGCSEESIKNVINALNSEQSSVFADCKSFVH
jgi:hypothetical protein